jgi:hypothetical protein
MKNSTNNAMNMTNENARIVACPNGELNVVYVALGMNVYMNNQAEAIELFNLINVEGLEVAELKALGFGW